MFKVSQTMRKSWKAWRRHDVRWTKYPLIAFVIVSIGPSAIAPILPRWHSGSLALGGIRFPDISALVYVAALLAVVNWPFLVLYFVCRQKVKKEWPSVRSVRLAMWISLVAMFLPNVLLLMGYTDALTSTAYDPFFDINLALFLFLWWVVPILGLIGWVAGRLIAWIIGLAIGET